MGMGIRTCRSTIRLMPALIELWAALFESPQAALLAVVGFFYCQKQIDNRRLRMPQSPLQLLQVLEMN